MSLLLEISIPSNKSEQFSFENSDLKSALEENTYKIEKNTWFLIIITCLYFLFTFHLIINDIIS